MLPDRLQVWTGAGLVAGAGAAAVFGLGRSWDFSTLDTLYAVGGVAAIGAALGTALAFAVHAVRRR